ncbi:hypothetical protein PTSG_08540 [Salpingoeca rosetta]|uniref:PH domain-containing protein n=1 Tax=Salpingoeca rosetta (strain ATCC 50818 / BSB-021) TaxID=946362 RepID=F2UJZ5_SALR5|nr:uncharacterized protein PTSG_08540 [Salpingoeca rosetta]EGD77444.1 hypothetical protein PTSG_08540 [Salpingoeca rosetta]|eukprot:XP_004990332.1 hypothetical protein PTSG_08540 [Salpingoeca rosetta]
MGKPVMSGWLTKEGGRVRNWKRRYFTLDTRHMLRYFKAETDAKEAGSIDMTQCREIVCASRCKCIWGENVNKSLAFGIVTPKRTYHIYGDRLDEVQQWMLAFKRAARITAAIPIGSPLVEGSTESSIKQRAEAHVDRARRISMHITQDAPPPDIPEPARHTVSSVPSVRRQRDGIAPMPPIGEGATLPTAPMASEHQHEEAQQSAPPPPSETSATHERFKQVFNLADSDSDNDNDDNGDGDGAGLYDNFDYAGRVPEDDGSASEGEGVADDDRPGHQTRQQPLHYDDGDGDGDGADEERTALIRAMQQAALGANADANGDNNDNDDDEGDMYDSDSDGGNEVSGGGVVNGRTQGSSSMHVLSLGVSATKASTPGDDSSDFFSSDEEDGEGDDGTSC